MGFLSDRLDKEIHDDPLERKFIEQHVGFGQLTIEQARAGIEAAQEYEDEHDEDLSGVIEGLEEIVDDLEFAANPNNAIVMWVNEHHAELEAKVREHYAVEDLMIRAHSDRKHLMILGTPSKSVDGIEDFVRRESGFPAETAFQSGS